jgi:hypothetical protein
MLVPRPAPGRAATKERPVPDHRQHRLRSHRSLGQSTVEYIGLLLAVGALLLAVSTQVKGGGLVGQIERGFTAAVQKVVGSADATARR